MPTVNVDTPQGFIPKAHGAGGVIRHAYSDYYIAGSLPSDIFAGDAVIPVNTNRRINVATAGVRLLGVFDGCEYLSPDGSVNIRPYWATGTAIKSGSVAKGKVYDDPFILFEIQADGVLAEADVGAFANIVVGAGLTATGHSQMELQSSSVGSGTQLRIEAFSSDVTNVRGVANAKAVVRLALHYLGPALTAI